MITELDNDEEKDYPSNLSELLRAAINQDSSYHHLGLLSLNTVIWNLDIYAYLENLLNFQVVRYYKLWEEKNSYNYKINQVFRSHC